VDEEDCLKSKYPKARRSRSLTDLLVPKPAGLPLAGLALAGLLMGSGCAHQQSDESQVQPQQQQVVAQLKSRLEEVERNNGRLSVRIEELEDQIFLLQDMTESNRIALRRRGYMKRGGFLTQQGDARAQAPQPTPESYYGSGSPYGNQQPNPSYQERAPQRRNVTRIPLSRGQSGAYGPENSRPADRPADQRRDQREQAPSQARRAAETGDGDELVITDEDFRRFAGDSPRKSKSSSSSSSSSSSGRTAQPPVTDEKLSTTEESDSQAESSDAPEAQTAAANVDKPLDLYKKALSDYRAGDYAVALTGFRAFLNAGPNSNYLDNALYWVGECHYGIGDYEKAVEYFQRVLREQPDGNKVPDAMLKMSLAYERLGNPEQSSVLLEKLTNRYPTTNAGRLGAQKLSELQN
jgi:tol-pal system protein YbgF